MEEIYINSTKYGKDAIDVLVLDDFAYMDLCKATNNVYGMYNKYRKEEEFVSWHINKNSTIFSIFNKEIKKFYNYFMPSFKTFKEAEENINSNICLCSIFNKNANEIFKDRFCSLKMQILEDNRLMFIKKNTPIFQDNKVIGYDFKNIILTPIQIYKMVNGYKNYYRAIEFLIRELGIEITGEEMEMKIKEREKIVNNLALLKDLGRYPNLNKFVKKNLFVLEAINLIGLNNSYADLQVAEDNNLIFLLTSNYLKKYIEDVSEQIKDEQQTTKNKVLSEGYIRRLLLSYASLGFINIVEPTQALKNREQKNNIKTKSYKYYTIQALDNNKLLEMDALARKFLNNKIATANITTAKVEAVLSGKEIKENKKENDEDKNFDYDFDFSLN